MYVIRRSKKKDASQVLKIAKQLSTKIGLADKKIRLEESVGTTKVIVACLKDAPHKVAGFVYAYMRGKGASLYASGNNHLYISAACVDKNHTKKGVAKSLVSNLVMSNSHRNIHCSVDIQDTASTSLLTNAGFSIKSSKALLVCNKQLSEEVLVKASMNTRPFVVESDKPVQAMSDGWTSTLSTLVGLISELSSEGRSDEANDLQGLQDYIGGMIAITGSKNASVKDIEIPTQEGSVGSPITKSVNDNDTLPTLSVGGGVETEMESEMEVIPEEVIEEVIEDSDSVDVVPDIIPGGLADNIPDSEFIPEQVAKGVEVELEHTDNLDIAKEISKDHLIENDTYYDKLEIMESDMEIEQNTENLGKIEQNSETRLEDKISSLDKDADYTQYPTGDSVYPELVEETTIDNAKNKIKELWESLKQEGSETLKLFTTEQAVNLGEQIVKGAKIATTLDENDKEVVKSFWARAKEIANSVTGMTVEEVLAMISPSMISYDKQDDTEALLASKIAELDNDVELEVAEVDRLNTIPVKSPTIKRVDGTEDEIAVQEGIPQNVVQLEELQESVTDFVTPTEDTVANSPEHSDHKEGGDVQPVGSIVHENSEYPVPKNMFEQKEMDTYNDDGTEIDPDEDRDLQELQEPESEVDPEQIKKLKKRFEEEKNPNKNIPNVEAPMNFNDGTSHHGSVTKKALKYCSECDENYVDGDKCPKCNRPLRELTVEDVQKQNNKLREMIGKDTVPVTGSSKTSKSVLGTVASNTDDFDFLASQASDIMKSNGTQAFNNLTTMANEELTFQQYSDELTKVILDNNYGLLSKDVLPMTDRSMIAYKDKVSVEDFFKELVEYGLVAKKTASYTEADIKEVIVESEGRNVFADDVTDAKKRELAIEFLEDIDEELEGSDLVTAAVKKASHNLGETQGDLLRQKMRQVGMSVASTKEKK